MTVRVFPLLFPYQQQGVDHILDRAAGLEHTYLGDDPGLGKTAQVVRVADKLYAQRILVLCPASLKVNWAREFQKFAMPNAPKRQVLIPTAKDVIPSGPLICIVNYDIVTRAVLHQRLADQHWDVLALDEAHALKNPTSKRTRAVFGEKGLYRQAGVVIPISGTPAPNHAGELYPALAALHPQALRGMDYDTWLRHYCHVVETTHGVRVKGHKPAIAQLKADLEGFMLRRKREDVLTDLPPLRISRLTVEHDAALEAVRREVGDEGDGELLQALVGGEASEELLEELDETQLSTLRRLCGEAKAHALVEEVAQELDSGLGKIVLMCWHRRTMDVLHEGLAAYGVARIDGSTKDRQAEVDKFQAHGNTTSCRVFVGQIQAAGAGHTLTAAQDMIVVEPSWVPGENVQAMLRIHRIGQLGACLVRFAALAHSIDEVIMAVAERKAQLLAEII